MYMVVLSPTDTALAVVGWPMPTPQTLDPAVVTFDPPRHVAALSSTVVLVVTPPVPPPLNPRAAAALCFPVATTLTMEPVVAVNLQVVMMTVTLPATLLPAKTV